MNVLARLCYGALGPWGERAAARRPKLQQSLLKAHVPMRASAYLATVWACAALAALMGLLFGLVVGSALQAAPWLLRALLPVGLAGILGGFALVAGDLWLANQAKELAKRIDENLPHGLNYMLALANAGLPPAAIWESLARARIFGPLAFEAERISRDLTLFGHDLLKALRLAQERTPSKLFHEFLQGAISAFQSGVELESYLMTKGAQFQHQAVEQQLEMMDTMGVMAEAFLVVVVAAPLFAIILLTVMAVNQGASVIAWGFVLVLVFIPLAQVILGALIRSMNPQVWT